jgi:hypothetical protein
MKRGEKLKDLAQCLQVGGWVGVWMCGLVGERVRGWVVMQYGVAFCFVESVTKLEKFTFPIHFYFFLISFHFAHTDGVSDGTSFLDAT